MKKLLTTLVAVLALAFAGSASAGTTWHMGTISDYNWNQCYAGTQPYSCTVFIQKAGSPGLTGAGMSATDQWTYGYAWESNDWHYVCFEEVCSTGGMLWGFRVGIPDGGGAFWSMYGRQKCPTGGGYHYTPVQHSPYIGGNTNIYWWDNQLSQFCQTTVPADVAALNFGPK